MTGLLLHGGTLVDGTGARPVPADVEIIGGTVSRIVTREPGSTAHPDTATAAGPTGTGVAVRDAAGLIVCPGFVDIHTHSDLTLLSTPSAPSKIHQGVTTEVVGNCGLGVAPLTSTTDLMALRAAVSYLDLDPDVHWDWHDTAGHLGALQRAQPSVNVATLTGHIPLRAATVGFADRPATRNEIARMRDLLRDSFAQGSLGLSTGLVYAPVCFANGDELFGLGSEVAAAGKVFAWHVRDYGDDLLPSVQLALQVATETGCRTQISHLAAVGRRNWGKVTQALELIDNACADGATVHVDAYPYLHGNAPLAQLLPSWAQEGDAAEWANRLADPKVRRRIREGWQSRALTWQEIAVSRLPARASGDITPGETVAEIAERRGVSGDDVTLDLLAECGTAALMIAGGRSEDDMRAALAHPSAVVASDGLSLDPAGPTGKGSPHPRCYGCFPRFLSTVGDSDPERIADAIRRCTSAPAQAIGLDGRGTIREGVPADIVVFDAATITDRATFPDPQLFPAGINMVMVNGEVVVNRGDHTGARPGAVLYG